MSTYKDKIKGLVCLVPNKSLITSESFSLSSHEKTLCDCQVLEIVREIESENEKLKENNKLLNGCIEDCEDSIKYYEKLDSENEKLKACVEFYANIGNWSGFEPDFTESKCIFSPPIDNEYNQDLTGFVSGKLARKTLSELKPSEEMKWK